ncbi:MAG: sel1 repeat family protein [Planctomycetaceae bacterium]|nr:sel1 repeat family protein [Planctomycetaceae bacterium]
MSVLVLIKRFPAERQQRILQQLPPQQRKKIEAEMETAEDPMVTRMRKEAEKGDAAAAFRFGLAYFSFSTEKEAEVNHLGIKADPKEAFKWFKVSADKGNANGQFALAICYGEGLGVAKDANKAKELFALSDGKTNFEIDVFDYNPKETPEQRRKKRLANAAAAGDMESQRKYALDFLEQKNKYKAAFWFDLAAKAGDKESQYQLALMFLDSPNWSSSNGCELNRSTAVKWLSESSEKIDAKTLYRIGELFDTGKGGTKDNAEAVKWFQQAADKGLPDAQYELANRYRSGSGGCPKDEKKSGELYQKCAADADKDVLLAQLCKGLCLQNGYGSEKNPEEAAVWFRKVAEQGDARGRYELGAYLEQAGGMKNHQEAFALYQKAAEQKYAPAMLNLGNCYQRGIGVAPDNNERHKWYAKAAEQGDAEAQYRIAVNHYDNKGNLGEAFKLFAKAAEQGHVQAQVNLGFCYLLAKGTKQDKAAAAKCFQKAAEQGDESAKELLKEIDNFNITP